MEPQSQAGVFLGWLSAQFVNDDDAQIGIKLLYAGKKINMSEKITTQKVLLSRGCIEINKKYLDYLFFYDP